MVSTRLLGPLFYFFSILVSLLAGRIGDVRVLGGVLAVGAVFSAFIYYVEYERPLIEARDEELDAFLQRFIFPGIESDYREIVDSDAEIRCNVMVLERRDLLFWNQERTFPPWPWEESLQVDYCTDGYEGREEYHTKWRVDEGVCGTAIEYQKDELWSDLESVDVVHWDMTERQLAATNHLGSVLSVPVYNPQSDDDDPPVAVLNVDSEANLDTSRLDNKSFRDEVIKYAEYVSPFV